MSTTEAHPNLCTLTLYSFNREGKKRWGWRLVAANGEKIARHSQGGGFKTSRSAWYNFKLIAFIFRYYELSGTVPKIGSERIYCDYHGEPMLRVRRTS